MYTSSWSVLPSYSMSAACSYNNYKNESTAGADASVKSLKLYDMKKLTLACLALLGTSTSLETRPFVY